MNGHNWITTAVAATACLWISPVLAADTTEPFDVGATDVEIYAGVDGVGPKDGERAIFGDLLLGFGLTPALSAYVGTTLSANEMFADGNADIYLGLYGTPLDSEHFDLDLFLDFAAGGDGFDEFALTPSTEINFDLDPDMGTWGLYLRAGVPIYGQPKGSAPAEHERAFDIEINPGTYVTLGELHQILVEYDMAFHPRTRDGHATDIGGVAVGYNVVLGPESPVELINQVYVDIPGEGETTSVGVSTGIIVTLPSARRDSVAQVARLVR